MILAALAGEHMLLLGPPGTAKSELSRRLSRLTGGLYFERLLTRFSVPEELFGPLSMKGAARLQSLVQYLTSSTYKLPSPHACCQPSTGSGAGHAWGPDRAAVQAWRTTSTCGRSTGTCRQRRWPSSTKSSRPTAPSSTRCSPSSTSACSTTATSASPCRCSAWWGPSTPAGLIFRAHQTVNSGMLSGSAWEAATLLPEQPAGHMAIAAASSVHHAGPPVRADRRVQRAAGERGAGRAVRPLPDQAAGGPGQRGRAAGPLVTCLCLLESLQLPGR